MLTGTFIGTMIANASVMTTFLFLQHYIFMHFVQDRSEGIRYGFRIVVSTMIGLLAMLFSYPVGNGVMFDTRMVAIILLGIMSARFPVYVPITTAVLLSIVRFFFSVSAGAYVNVILMLTSTGLLIAVNKLYLERQPFVMRLVLNSLIGTVWSVVLTVWTGVLPRNLILMDFILLLVSALVMGLVCQVLLRDYLLHRSLRAKAETDFLTGLMNRSSIDSFLAVHQNEELSVAILDIDHFKQVNDTYGHEVGDRVIQHAAHLIQQSVRSYDQVARYGGEEFLVVFPHLNLQAASEIAERIRRSFEHAAIDVGDQVISITVSIGVASLKEGTTSDFMRLADDRLYQAKRMGRNCIVLEG